MTYLCTGSFTIKAANREPKPDPSLPNLKQINWTYTSGDCQDCGHRFDFVPHPRASDNRLVLPQHYVNGKLKETP